MTPATSSSRTRSVAGWALTLALGLLVFVIVKWLGLGLAVVATDSMVPALAPRDMVLLVSASLLTPERGDIVAFEPVMGDTALPAHTHRLVDGDSTAGWQTKGDASGQPDPWVVAPDQIRGVVVAAVPAGLLRSPILMGLGAFLVAMLAFWPRSDSKREQPTLPVAHG